MLEKGGIIAATVYQDGILVARNCVITLPSVNYKTIEHSVMGTAELPMFGQVEAMEASVTKKGFSNELAILAEPGAHDLEFRFVQESISNDASAKPQACRAYMRACPKTFPGGDLTPGDIGDSQVTFAVTRYQLFVNGVETCLIDQLKCIQRINGTDYAKTIDSML